MSVEENGINFHKLTKGLSTSALRCLINIAKQETMRRKKVREFPQFENKELPKLNFSAFTVLKIKEIEWKITSFTYYTIKDELISEHYTSIVENAYVPTYVIDVNLYKWETLVEKKTPIRITLTMLNDNHVHQEIELHSRSKIFWFHKLLENATELPFERKYSFKESVFNSIKNL